MAMTEGSDLPTPELEARDRENDLSILKRNDDYYLSFKISNLKQSDKHLHYRNVLENEDRTNAHFVVFWRLVFSMRT